MEKTEWLALVNLLLSWRNTFGFRLAPEVLRPLAGDLVQLEDTLAADTRTGAQMWLDAYHWLQANAPQEKANG
jgi:hypothetical protein